MDKEATPKGEMKRNYLWLCTPGFFFLFLGLLLFLTFIPALIVTFLASTYVLNRYMKRKKPGKPL